MMSMPSSMTNDRSNDEAALTKQLDVLVVDSGAIIKGYGMNWHKIAKKFVTIEEVVAEIRDSKSRDLLLKLPYELEIISPSESAMKAVGDFARKSGDFANLSLTDLKVLALSYSLEVECNNGGKYLRSEPIKKSLDKTTSSNINKNAPEVKDANSTGSEPIIVGKTLPITKPVAVTESVDADADADAIQQEEDECYEENDDYYSDEDDYENDNEDDYNAEKDNETHFWGRKVRLEEPQKNIDLDNVTTDDFPELSLGGKEEKTALTVTISVASKWANIATIAKAEDDDVISFARREKPIEEKLMDKSSVYNAVDHFSGNGTNPELAFLLKEEARVDALKEAAVANELKNIARAGEDYDKKFVTTQSRIIGGGNSGGNSSQAMERAREEDDGEGWIGVSNIKECQVTGKNMLGSQSTIFGTSDITNNNTKSKSKGSKKKKGNSKPFVNNSPIGCVTTDFTMQNVMMQMNMRVISVDGMIIRNIRHWVMRCMACYTTHTDMNRIFCSRCGVDHMSRVACSIDANTGELRLHLSSKYKVSKRGKQYSMPAPGKQGRFQGELLTREDQLMGGIWRQKVVKMQKDVRSAFGQDVTSDVGLQVNKSQHIRPGLGRPNPNADKGRERRGASKKKPGK
jgi:rRNA maturation endonuclease Nob1